MGWRALVRFARGVRPGADNDTDWRDPAPYAPLLDADRSFFAWEWLRRDPCYRAAARRARPASAGHSPCPPESWGLHAFEDPRLAASRARPLWTAEAHPASLAAVAAGSGAPEDLFDLARFAPIATLHAGRAGSEHLLLSDGLRSIRVDILAGSLAQGPVQLRYLIAGLASAEGPLLTLWRLIALCRSGRFAATLHPPEIRARRFILMLRAHDAMADGATQREIAATLLSTGALEDRWRVTAPTLRSRVQRLVRAARGMAAGGYRALLR